MANKKAKWQQNAIARYVDDLVVFGLITHLVVCALKDIRRTPLITSGGIKRFVPYVAKSAVARHIGNQSTANLVQDTASI